MPMTAYILAVSLAAPRGAAARGGDGAAQAAQAGVSGARLVRDGAQVQVLRISSGPSGSETAGTFALSEERSAFNRAVDREAIVSFEWQGAPGAHKLVARWTGPGGNFSSTSAIDYVARDRRFGAYWRLTLSPSMLLGTWSIEATVDGEAAGRYTFEVTDTPVAGTPVKRPLAQAEIYERLNRMFVAVERAPAAGRQLDAGAGFVGREGKLFTAVSVLDDVDVLRGVFGDGSRRDLTTLTAYNRQQDWAVVSGPDVETALAIASFEGINVGDRCFSMEGGTTGGRVLTECTIAGRRSPAAAGFIATFLNGAGTTGAPVLNEYGEVIGIVGASAVAGVPRAGDVPRFRGQSPIVPFNLVRVPAAAPPSSIAELRAKGALLAAVTGDRHVVSGGFSPGINKGMTVAPSDQRDEFSTKEPRLTVFVSWDPEQTLKGAAVVRLFDAANRVVAESKTGKLSLRKRQLSLSSWVLPMVSAPGVYRADVLLDGKPMWRGFVRITP